MAEAGVRSLTRSGFSRTGVTANVGVWLRSFGWISRLNARDKMSGLP